MKPINIYDSESSRFDPEGTMTAGAKQKKGGGPTIVACCCCGTFPMSEKSGNE